MGLLRPDPVAGSPASSCHTVLLVVLLSWMTMQVVQLSESLEFTRPLYNVTVSENSVGKTYVLAAEKMGIFFSDPSLTVRYKIVSGDPQKMFKAESRAVGDFSFLLIRTRTEEQAVLNREYQDSYLLGVRATITSLYKKLVKVKAHTDVHVRVLDTNDLNPLFYPVDYRVSVPEDYPLHKAILYVTATDPDIGINGEVYYSLAEPSFEFAVHPTGGFISLTRPLDHQLQPLYMLTVVAEDRGPKFRAVTGTRSGSTATVQIKVTPVNLHSPEILIRQLPAILEHSDPELYAIVRVTDQDKGQHGEIDSLEIVGGDRNGYFHITTGEAKGEFKIQPTGDKDLSPGDYALTLRATDRGSPPRSSVKVVHVKVSETSRRVPKFAQSDYDVEVEEVVPVGFPLIRLNAYADGREKLLLYAIERGNDEGVFGIDLRSGLLATIKKLDREERAYYSLTVSAVERGHHGRRKGTAIVNIRVLDDNDNDPLFNASSVTVTFDENRTAGSLVYSVHATDSDKDDNGYVTYSLANLESVPFVVDHFSGEIRTTEVLDYETMRREYLLRVRASDWGSPYRRQAETTVRVKVRDINDHRPLFEKVDCLVEMSEVVASGSEVLTLSALDFDAGSIVHYLVVPSNDHPCFRLDTSTGSLRTTCDLTSYGSSGIREWTLNMSATDGQHFADVTTVRLRVLPSSDSLRWPDVQCREAGVADKLTRQIRLGNVHNRPGNSSSSSQAAPTKRYGENKHAPEFLPTVPREIKINESASFGSEVVAVRARDRDHGYAGLLVYVVSLMPGDDDNSDLPFRMDLYTGRLIVDAELDREKTAKYTLNVSAFDLGRPQRSASRVLVVNLRDVNDNPPVFERDSYQFAIPENVAVGFSILRLRAEDSDEGSNAVVHYGLEGPAWDKFNLDPDSGLLTVVGQLDRETTESYYLRVWARDSCPDEPLTSWATVHVRLEDVNDNAPVFGLAQFWVKAREDLPVGAVVMVMSAKDPDLGDGGKVAYEATGGTFSVDPMTGVVRIAQQLDFEQKQLYNVTVAARDLGDPPMSSVAFLLVEVEDVNENTNAPVFEDVVASGSVLENQPEGTLVMQVSATDADPPGVDSYLTYSIRDGDGLGFFTIDDQGHIRTRAVLDRESSTRYWFTVVAQDRGAVPLTSRLDVYVEVKNENDNVPLTLEPAYYPSVPESSPEGTSVVKLEAFDLDAAEDGQQRITFDITAGDPQGFFAIDRSSGLITTTSRSLDREAQAEHVLEVTANDNGDPPLSSTTRVVVRVIDVNDHEPAFFHSLHRCYVTEMAKPGPTICQVLATDEDSGPSGDITYFLEGTNSHLYRIHPKTGAIYSQGPLRSGQQFELLVTASDGGKPSLSSKTRLIIEVVAIPNEERRGSKNRAPVILQQQQLQTGEPSQIVLSESEPVGQLVALVQARDPDNDRIWYSITGGNVGEMFMIQSDGGAVFLARKLKWEMHSVYNLTVSVSDGLSAVFTNLNIRVMSINNYMPEFLEHTYKVDISENSPVDTKILRLEAIDRDQDKRLIYTIHNSASPHSLTKFRLDSTTGLLSIAESLDHETAQRHILTVAITDSGTPSKRCFTRLEVNVHDHNDHAPTFLRSMVESQVYETATLGTAVLQVMAVDRDKGRNAQLTYSIVSGNVGSSFSIDPNLGTVHTSQHLDRRYMSEYFLIVRATDGGQPPLNGSVTVHVVVTVADNAAPKFEKSRYAVELYENGRSESKVAVVSASSRSSVYYEIVAGNVNDTFFINPTSGLVRTTRPLDYEAVKFYNVTVRATNMVGSTADATVLVHVLDRNDNRPVFMNTEVVGVISEAADADSIVLDASSAPLVVAASDADSELNAVLRYSMVEKTANLYFRIDASTGAVSTAQALDHEKFANFTFTVQVTDTGKPQLSAVVPATVTVLITDVNDCSPQFEYPTYAATVLLPTYRDVTVARVRATDPDTVGTGSIKYNIVSGNDGDKFQIDEDTGVISIRNHEDLREEYQLVVSASDSEFEASAKVAVKVKEPLASSTFRFSRPKYEATVIENSTGVVTVAVVTPVGIALNEHLEFDILNPTGMFEIGRTSGAVRTKKEDEVPFDREMQSAYVLVVEVRGGPHDDRVAHVLVEVTVLDVNDNAPIFVNLPYYSVVPTEVEKGYIVRKVHAIDLDVGENGHVHYELVEGDNETYHVDRKTGEIVLLRPVATNKLDYTIVVAAIDSGTPSLRSMVQVPIRLINRDMPVFPKPYYNVSVAESLPAKSPVITVLADSPEGRQLIYSIVEDDDDDQDDFYVDFSTDPAHSNGPCILKVSEGLDFERRQRYALRLRATDSVSGAFADVIVHVQVEDINDNSPEFESASYEAAVSEAAPFGTSVLRVRAVDRDSANHRRIQYYIIGNATSHFHVESSEGIVFVKQALDRERESSHCFVILATDGGSPPLSATASVVVDVLDMNDNPPRFERSPSQGAIVISESAPRGHFVTRVLASDPDVSDSNKLVYALVEGNEQQAFAIHPVTGIVTLSNLHQFSNQSVYSLNVSVTDGVYSSYTRIRVDVLGANGQSPAFTRTVYEVTVAENREPGVPVATVKAKDLDRGDYGKITYSIESQLFRKLFSIDPETGVLYTAVSFDREKQSLYKVLVAAFDSGGRPGYATVRVTVTNENDNAPVFPVAEYRAYVQENTSVGTTVLQVHAVDADDEARDSSTIEYSIYASNTSAVSELFSISKDRGEIYLKKSLSKLGGHAFQFFVRASDRGSPPQENEVAVNVIVVSTDAFLPRFEQPSYEFFVSERSPIGTVVSAMNTSAPVSEPIRYGFVAAPAASPMELHQSLFTITDQGKIVLNSALDRETTAVYRLSVKAETVLGDPPVMAFCDLTVHVMDENDNSPVFESNPYVVSVAENVEKGSSMLRVVAHDLDVGTSGEVRYFFGIDVGRAANVFRLDEKTGWITSLTSLDYETVTSYNFSVVARDKGHPPLSSTAAVSINVLDYNDNPPTFERQRYDIAIYENTSPGTDIVSLEIEDADSHPAKVDFYIVDGNPLENFQVRQTGEVFVHRALDREAVSHYLLELVVTDGLFTSSTKVSIDVLDANDNPPICLKPRYNEWLSEAVPPNTFVTTIEATDADDGRNALRLFSLRGVGADDFLIDSATGVVKTVKNLDREQRPRYALRALVQDRGRPEWSCSSDLDIQLGDVNDNPPQFTQLVFTVSIAEDVPVGTLLTKVHASDTDLGMNRRISYMLTESAGGHFIIDAQTGIVRVQKPLDRESQPSFNLSVQASDHGDPPLASVVPLQVSVLDCNDNPPEFESKMLSATLSETASLGYQVVQVRATSRDIGLNAQISYAIVAGDEMNAFHIDFESGIITVAKELDYEALREYFLTIQAIDAGSPPLSSQAVVNITLTDANDNTPRFSQASYRALVQEDAQMHSAHVIQVIASDADSGANARLSFSIVSGDTLGQFAVDRQSGLLTIAAPLDREMIPSYILHVQCSDSGTPELSSTALVNIEVSDVNDNAPLFSQTNYTAVIQEGKPLGYTVLKFNILDADSPPNTGPFSLAIISGNSEGAFRLVQQDATLRTNAKYDHRSKDQYRLLVRVTDNGSPPLSSEVWVTVLVIEESQFPPTVSSLEVTINSYLDDFPGGVMGRIHAVDQDPYDELHFGLVSPFHDLFSVDREDGTLVALPGLDVGTYTVNVSVSDGKFTSFGTVSVEVNLVSEDALKNGVGLRLMDVTPEDFLLTHRRNFVLALRSVLSKVRSKDIDILSVQPALQQDAPKARKRRSSSSSSQDLDVLFAARKSGQLYYTAKQVATRIKEKQALFEATAGLKVSKIMKDRCSSDRCVHGDCVDHILFDDTFVVSISTESLSFVSPQHSRKIECLCEPGFGGSFCDAAINECARKPCAAHFICFPDPSDLGYVCQCPSGKTGPTCDQDKAKTCQQYNCYEEKNPISYNGRSYARYSLVVNSLDRQLNVVLHMRTIQSTGNLMYASGIRDYSILEVVEGFAQYRFDCGSGEGLVRVLGHRVSDGEWHEIRLDRRGNSAELVVDGKHRSSGHAPGPHDVLNLNSHDVYFGAEVRHHPSSSSSAAYEDIRMGFVGCMDNVHLDGVPLPLHTSSPGISALVLRRLVNVEFQCNVLFDPGACGSQPCANGGSCRASGSAYTCQCLPRFLGHRCEVDTNPCASGPCLNGASCHNVNNTFRCDCPQGLSGSRCDYGRFCNPNPCHHGGACEEGTYGALCKCRGFYGDQCQYDVDECQARPCASGATCRNVPGSFRCQCPPNVTGVLCTEPLHTNSITSTRWNTTIEEIVGIAVLVVFIMLMAGTLACCWRIRHKRRQRRPGLQLVDDPAANEFMLKNPIMEDSVKHLSKLSLEATFATPPLPPRPASYTPSTQESLNALAKFDTAHTYGSAAEDLEGRNAPLFGQNNLGSNKTPPHVVSAPPSLSPPPPSNSGDDSLKQLKTTWVAPLTSSASKENIYEEKIQNRYHWDISDWATSPATVGSTFDVSPKEDSSSSLQSSDSNSFVSQIERLPSSETVSNLPPDSKLDEAGEASKCSGEAKEDEQPLETAYSPPLCFANDDPLSSQPLTAEDEEGVQTYGFPLQGGPGFLRVALEGSGGSRNSGQITPNSSVASVNVGRDTISARVSGLGESDENNRSEQLFKPSKCYYKTKKPSYV